MRARGARGEGRKGPRVHTYTHNFYNKTIARRFGCAARAGLLIGLGYVADITYMLRHDAWPKSLVPISPSVYVCMSKPIGPLSDGRIEKKKRKERGEREEKKE